MYPTHDYGLVTGGLSAIIIIAYLGIAIQFWIYRRQGEKLLGERAWQFVAILLLTAFCGFVPIILPSVVSLIATFILALGAWFYMLNTWINMFSKQADRIVEEYQSRPMPTSNFYKPGE